MPRAKRRCSKCERWRPCPVHPEGWSKDRPGYVPLPRNWKSLVRAATARDTRLYGRPRCAGCGVTSDLELDHIIPRFAGGPNTLDNLEFRCGRKANNCHGKKTQRDNRRYGKGKKNPGR